MRLEGVEWDDDKNETNKREHEGLSFEQAQYVFADSERLERLDRSEGNTSEEERWRTLGMVVISARLADKPERRSYNGYYQIDGKGWRKAT